MFFPGLGRVDGSFDSDGLYVFFFIILCFDSRMVIALFKHQDMYEYFTNDDLQEYYYVDPGLGNGIPMILAALMGLRRL